MLGEFAQWLKDTLLWIPRKLWAEMLEGGASFIDSIKVPEFLTRASGYLDGIPSGVLWTLNMFAVPEGMLMIGVALVLRFVLRRIPFFG